MNDLVDLALLFLAQLGGGPGPRENNLVRFGLPAILWSVLLIITWHRQRQDDLPRERLLIWGFAIALIRELFMFSHVSLHILGLSGKILPLSTEPLEHGLTMASIVMVAGAFLRYILDDSDLSRRYLQTGLGITVICYATTFWWWTQQVAATPGIRFNRTWGGFLVHLATSGLILVAIFLLMQRQGWLRNVVILALTLFLCDEAIRIFNFATAKAYSDIVCPIGNNLHIWAIPLLGYVYSREQAIEKKQAEEKLTAYREHLEELVEERTSELTQANTQLHREITDRKHAQAESARRNAELAAQNAIAATISHSLDLNNILDAALNQVLKVLEVEAGCVFLLDTVGETLSLQTYRRTRELDSAHEQTRYSFCRDVSAQAVSEMQPVVSDVSKLTTEDSPSPKINGDIHTLISTPLVSKDRAVGALTLEAKNPDTITPQRLELLTSIGQQIGVAVENARLYQETERWAEDLTLLHQVSIFLNSTLDPDMIYRQVNEQAPKLLDCQVAHIFRWDEEHQMAVGVSSYGVEGKGVEGTQIPLDEDNLLSALVSQRQSITIDGGGDGWKDSRILSSWQNARDSDALLCVPVWGRESPLGFLFLIDRRGPRKWRPDEVELIESFINRAAVALENAHLHKQLEWAAALEERQRIAAEMHDGLAQTLSYMGHRVDQIIEADTSQIAPILHECHHVRDIIDQAHQEVRRSIASLQEPPLPRRPLQDWLVEIVEGFAKNNAPSIRLLAQHRTPLFLPPGHIEHVRRIVREALTNAVHHAQAQKIIVRMERRRDMAKIVVDDDGQGFDPQSPVEDGMGHFGLNIMQARAARINGRLEIDTALGHGTRVILTWALQDMEREGNGKNSRIVGR